MTVPFETWRPCRVWGRKLGFGAAFLALLDAFNVVAAVRVGDAPDTDGNFLEKLLAVAQAAKAVGESSAEVQALASMGGHHSATGQRTEASGDAAAALGKSALAQEQPINTTPSAPATAASAPQSQPAANHVALNATSTSAGSNEQPGKCQDGWSLVWFSDELWESDYVPHWLLKDVKLRGQTHKRWDDPVDDCTIAVVRGVREASTGHGAALMALEKRFAAAGLRRAYVMLGEEETGCAKAAEFYASAPVVFRNYWVEDCLAFPSIIEVPLGLAKQNVAPNLTELKPMSKRKFSWSFSSIHGLPARTRFVEAFTKLLPKDFSLKYPGEDKEYMKTLCDTKFALAPRGNSQETFRLSESLECGAIPVVADSGKYFSKFMPKRLVDSFITLDDSLSNETMNFGAEAMASLLQDPTALDRHGQELLLAWQEYKDAIRKKVVGVLGLVAQNVQQTGASQQAVQTARAGELAQTDQASKQMVQPARKASQIMPRPEDCLPR